MRPSAAIPTTLPARYYTDPDLYQREIDRFFCRRWVCAGRANAVPQPGDYFLRQIAHESILVLRDRGGEVRAFYDVCRHRGTRICTEEQGNFEGRIRCPYHGWTYDLEGRLIGAPHMDRESFQAAEYPLLPVATGAWGGHIFIHLDAVSEPLEAQLGGLPAKFAPWQMQDLALYRRIAYDVEANWKLVIANYNECLHCPLVHPALNRLTDYLGAENEAPTRHYFGGAMGFRGGAETMSLDGQKRRAWLPGLGPEERRRVYYYAVLPNLLLSLHPDYMMVHTLWPKAVDQTRIVCEWHFHPSELAKPDFSGDDAVEFWDKTNREDWEMVERSQAGIASRAYRPGPYSPREELLSFFDSIVREERP